MKKFLSCLNYHNTNIFHLISLDFYFILFYLQINLHHFSISPTFSTVSSFHWSSVFLKMHAACLLTIQPSLTCCSFLLRYIPSCIEIKKYRTTRSLLACCAVNEAA